MMKTKIVSLHSYRLKINLMPSAHNLLLVTLCCGRVCVSFCISMCVCDRGRSNVTINGANLATGKFDPYCAEYCSK